MMTCMLGIQNLLLLLRQLTPHFCLERLPHLRITDQGSLTASQFQLNDRGSLDQYDGLILMDPHFETYVNRFKVFGAREMAAYEELQRNRDASRFLSNRNTNDDQAIETSSCQTPHAITQQHNSCHDIGSSPKSMIDCLTPFPVSIRPSNPDQMIEHRPTFIASQFPETLNVAATSSHEIPLEASTHPSSKMGASQDSSAEFTPIIKTEKSRLPKLFIAASFRHLSCEDVYSFRERSFTDIPGSSNDGLCVMLLGKKNKAPAILRIKGLVLADPETINPTCLVCVQSTLQEIVLWAQRTRYVSGPYSQGEGIRNGSDQKVVLLKAIAYYLLLPGELESKKPIWVPSRKGISPGQCWAERMSKLQERAKVLFPEAAFPKVTEIASVL